MKELLLLFGGESAERDVSRATALACGSGLERIGWTVRCLDPLFPDQLLNLQELAELDQPGKASPVLQDFPADCLAPFCQLLLQQKPALVFNCLHGGMGEDGRLAALMDLLQIPCSSSPALGAALAMDKARSKRWMRGVGIATPDWISIDPAHPVLPDVLPTGPWVVKPNSMGSSVGIHMVEDPLELPLIVEEVAALGDLVLVERFIAGRELTQAWLSGERFPVVEVAPREGWYDYQRKYSGGTDYHCPAEIPDNLARQICEWTEVMNVGMGCRGATRADFRLDEQGRAWCLELNTTPGMTDSSLVPKAAAARGWSFERLLEEIVRRTLAVPSRRG